MKLILIFLFIGATQGFLNGFFGGCTKVKDGPEVTSEGNHPEPEPVMSKGVMVPLELRNDVLIGRVTVGTKSKGQYSQDLFLNINLASAMVILYSGEICKEKDCSKLLYKTFFGEQSRSYAKTDRPSWPLEVNGGDFHVEGFYARDHFKFEKAHKTIVIKDQEFLEAKLVKKPFPGYDGEFGLALKTGNSLHEAAPVHTMEKQFKDVEPVFGIYINTNDQYGGEIGNLILGGGDEQFYKKEDLRSHDVLKIDGGYKGWYINVQRLVVIPKEGGRVDVDLSSGGATPAPELNYIAFPLSHLKTLREKLFPTSTIAQVQNLVSCDSWQSLPDLAFVIGDHEYILTPKDYVVKNQYPHQCFTRLHPSSTNNIQLGRPFLQKFYTRFNVKNKQVQLAESSGGY